MISTGLISVKDKILSEHSYLNKGYEKAHYVANKGVFVENKRIFPDDTNGNYFYFRIAERVNLTQEQGMSIVAPIVCVVCMKGADAEKLFDNITNTLMRTCNSVAVTSAQLLRDDVVRTELRGAVSDKEVDKALGSMADWTIISISFNYAFMALPKPADCIENPCKC